MSFSTKVKDELSLHISKARHCRVAELGAILSTGARISLAPALIEVQSEHKALVLKTETYLRDLFHIHPLVLRRIGRGGSKVRLYLLRVQGDGPVRRILSECGFLEGGVLREMMPDQYLTRACCRRAYLRGAFLAGGSINDPTKNYHIEILNDTRKEAERLQEFLADYEVGSRILERSRQGTSRITDVLYLKDSEQIVDVLRIMKAPLALMELENVRVEKDVKNRIQRRVNCEAANINKTVEASVRQSQAIGYLMSEGLFSGLPDELKEIAELRMEYPDMALKDLGVLVDPPISKSGVNHRLKKIIQISEEHKERKERHAGNTSDRR